VGAIKQVDMVFVT